MSEWNPWHGCRKISEGCRYCYVYRMDAKFQKDASVIHQTKDYDLPLRKRKNNEFYLRDRSLVYTCFTSDFLLAEADAWRPACWDMMRQRPNLMFLFLTKRIDRFLECIPSDWGNGYHNVIVGCTVENEAQAKQRLPLFQTLPIAHKMIICQPLLSAIDLTPYLNASIEQVVVGGEMGLDARICDYDWVLQIHEQCMKAKVSFVFRQTGALFRKDGKLYRIPHKHQVSQAKKAGLDRWDTLPNIRRNKRG